MRCLLFAAFLLPLAAMADDAPFLARIAGAENARETIPRLKWADTKVEIAPEYPDAGVRPRVLLRGTFDKAETSLISGETVLVRSDSKEKNFELVVPLTGEVTRVNLMSADSYGSVEVERLLVEFPEWERYQKLAGSPRAAEASEPRLPVTRLTVTLGVSSIAYHETRNPDVSELALTPKIAIDRPFAGTPWSAGANLYVTAIPLTTSPGTLGIRFFGFNARAGYAIPLPSPWSMTLMGGAYYTTTFTSGKDFGFTGMFGPQVFPVVRRFIGARDTVSAYFKYSPIAQGFDLTFSSHELATGVAWARLLRGNHPVSLSADLAKIDIDLDRILLISSTSVTLSVSYGF